jgi:hypothetical protein
MGKAIVKRASRTTASQKSARSKPTARLVLPTGELAPAEPLIKLRPYAVDPFWNDDLRTVWWVWARQKGKSFTAAAKALRRMMGIPGLLSVFVSASMRLGEEFIRKEAMIWQSVMKKFQLLIEEQNRAAGSEQLKFESAASLDIDAIADLFEHQKLETKIWHDRTTYSRSIVVAPNPDTAVGWTGDIFLDEFGRMPEFKEVLEAVLPFMTSNPQFRLNGTSTPPPDDKHYSYELTVPQEEHFAVNSKGNWYRSQAGFMVHRVDVWDAEAAGIQMYDDITGEPVTPNEHRARAFDKTAWDRNHGLRFIRGGSAALALNVLHHAMTRGANEGIATDITEQITLAA